MPTRRRSPRPSRVHATQALYRSYVSSSLPRQGESRAGALTVPALLLFGRRT